MDSIPFEEIVEQSGCICIKTLGTSMRPFIVSGRDTVFVVKNNARLKKRDVALYRRNDGTYVLHRVVRVMNDSYVMCGDNHCFLERGVTDSQILGVLEGYYRGEKYISCKSFWYRLRVWLWCIMPLRKTAFFIKRVISKLKRMFKKNK